MGLVIAGCDNKETVLDIDTPDGGVEVERDRDDGALSIDVDE
ncbi:signal peptide protein [Rhodopirellula sp. SWK7]|nr:signal peptide protein [Rhodopirellula sp. SWK7]